MIYIVFKHINLMMEEKNRLKHRITQILYNYTIQCILIV